jgi:hypothetical protein
MVNLISGGKKSPTDQGEVCVRGRQKEEEESKNLGKERRGGGGGRARLRVFPLSLALVLARACSLSLLSISLAHALKSPSLPPSPTLLSSLPLSNRQLTGLLKSLGYTKEMVFKF